MSRLHSIQIVFAAVIVVLTMSMNAQAEIPKKSREKLKEMASHQLIGTVTNTYERKETRGQFEFTLGVAEVAVEEVGKGTDIEKRDCVFVRYWNKRWTGSGNPPPDHYGHWNIPQKSDKAEIYVKGDRQSGFDVLSPNGFFERK